MIVVLDLESNALGRKSQCLYKSRRFTDTSPSTKWKGDYLMSLEKNPNMSPDDPILTAEEWDVLSDGYDLESDISIPCYEPRDRWPDAVFPDKYQIPDSCLTPVKRQFTANC